MDEQLEQIKNIEGAIEAILFAAGYPVKYTKIAEVLGLDLKNTKMIIENMSEGYNSAKSIRGVNLLLFPDTCQLCTKEQYAPYIREALGIKRGGNLSASSMEVLAVVAYNQPVTKAFVEQVRGVDCSGVIGSLTSKDLIEEKGRLELPGRPLLYGTTENFLRCFNIADLEQLPPLPETEEDKAEQQPQEAEAAEG